MIQLQSRDRVVLRICYEQQFLRVEHVRCFYPKNSSGREVWRRIAELEAAGFIRRVSSPVLGKERMIRVTSAGRAIAESEGAFKVQPARQIPAATLIHDSLVTSARLRLESLWSASFVCERAIKEGDYPTIPDGVFFFASGKAIALEVENSDKGKTRFQKLASRWKESPSITLVLYVARDQSLASRLKRYLLECDDTKPLALVEWPALRDGLPKIWTVRGEFPYFDRREIL